MADSFIQEVKNLIQWEIDVLNNRIQGQSDLKTCLDQKRAEVQQQLVTFQMTRQLVTEDDINNWKDLKGKTLPLPASLNKQLAGVDKKTVFIQVLNTWLESPEVDTSFAPPGTSEEFDNLRKTVKAWGAGDKIRYKRLLVELCIPELRHRPGLILEASAGSRYWRPNDPVMLIAGLDPSPRHTKEEPATITTPNWMQGDTMSKESYDTFREIKEITGLTSPAGAKDWHPILMDWETEFNAIELEKNDNYDTGYIADHFDLGTTDFKPKGTQSYNPSSTSLKGRAVLTPYGKLTIQKTLAIEITNQLNQLFYKEANIKGNPTIAGFTTWVNTLATQLGDLPKADPLRDPAKQITDWLEAQLETDGKNGLAIVNGFISKITKDTEDPILDLFFTEQSISNRDLSANLAAFVHWASPKTKLKATFASVKKISEPMDIWLAESEAHQARFVTWLTTQLGSYWPSFEKAHPTLPQNLKDLYGLVLADFQPKVRASLHRAINLCAYLKLPEIGGLAQALSGFDQAMLQHKQVLQIPIKDPFPADPDTQFVLDVQSAVSTAGSNSPSEPLPFSPLRSGKLSINRLDLIDNYGRSWGWGLKAEQQNNITTSINMRGGASNEAILMPRFAQAVRLNFRWLSAWHNLVEMNSHPATNPICGWFMANNLDGSLMVYGAKGQAYGYIDQMGVWRVFPGNSGPIIPDDIENSYLARTVKWLCEKGKANDGYISLFLDKINGAMENIEPENFAQHEALSLLMGKPLALVRAAVNLELKGDLAINFKNIKFNHDVNHLPNPAPDPKSGLEAYPRETFGYEHVNVPVRIGEYRQLNDGVVVYWTEGSDGELSNTYNIPESKNPPPNLMVNLSQKTPQLISMLIDPRGKAHATCGLQPVKEIHIPSDQYADALKAIEIAFLATPILTPSTGIHLSLPKEPGYSWSWVEKDGSGWREVGTLGIIGLTDLEKVFKAQASTIWQMLTAKGWIVPIANNKAHIVPSDQRAEPKLGQIFKALEPQIEILLESCHINAMNPSATFGSAMDLREGWLKLKTKG